MVLVIKFPGLVAKWSSSGGIYGPLQRCSTAADMIPDGCWEPRYVWWTSATMLADASTAIVLTCSVTRAIRGRSSNLPTGEQAAWTTSRLTSHVSSWVSLGVGAAGMLGSLCSGRNLYVLPWAVAALFFADTCAEEPAMAGAASPMAEVKQL